MLLQLRNFLISTKFLEGAISVLIATARSKSFFSLVDDFRWFDTYTLRTECRTDQKPQILYLSYALSIEVYVLLVSLFHEHKVNLLLKFTWVIVSVSIMLMITQFVAFVQLLRQRYTTANSLFSSSKRLLAIIFLPLFFSVLSNSWFDERKKKKLFVPKIGWV